MKSYMGLSGYSSTWLSSTINTIIAEQKKRIGTFLIQHSKLLDLKSRAENIKKADVTAGTSLIGRIDTALATQSRLEGQGLNIFSEISAIQNNAIVKAFTGQTITYAQFSPETTGRLDTLISDVKDLLVSSARVNEGLEAHASNVKTIEKDITRIEGDLVGRGLMPKAKSLLSIPAEITKHLGYIALAGGALFILSRGGAFKRSR